MSFPLYQAKAEFFRMLGHPVRIRVLELLTNDPPGARPAHQLDVEPSSLSQQLASAPLGMVTATRGKTVVYEWPAGTWRS